MTSLDWVSNDDLIDELKKRGVACVVAIVSHDEETGPDDCRLALHHGGELDVAVWAASNLVERVWTHCEDAGFSPVEIAELTELIVYDEHTDQDRLKPPTQGLDGTNLDAE